MKTARFSSYEKGLLLELLLDAYSSDKGLIRGYEKNWKEFDAFVFENLSFMDDNGFISLEGDTPIGFITWDPRKLPDSIEIGHNCIVTGHKGSGKGREQLSLALRLIGHRNPRKIIVKTGNAPFFMPARKMYEAAGFIQKPMLKGDDAAVPEKIEYELGL